MFMSNSCNFFKSDLTCMSITFDTLKNNNKSNCNSNNNVKIQKAAGP